MLNTFHLFHLLNLRAIGRLLFVTAISLSFIVTTIESEASQIQGATTTIKPAVKKSQSQRLRVDPRKIRRPAQVQMSPRSSHNPAVLRAAPGFM